MLSKTSSISHFTLNKYDRPQSADVKKPIEKKLQIVSKISSGIASGVLAHPHLMP